MLILLAGAVQEKRHEFLAPIRSAARADAWLSGPGCAEVRGNETNDVDSRWGLGDGDLGLCSVGGRAPWKVGLGTSRSTLPVSWPTSSRVAGKIYLCPLQQHLDPITARGAGSIYLGFDHQGLHVYEQVAILDLPFLPAPCSCRSTTRKV